MQSAPLVHGHRGFRGQWPENTLTGFEKAAALGVDFVELDVVISSDNKVVVSHDPYMNMKFCLDSAGNGIADDQTFNLYKMRYEEIARFDCGTKVNADFPEQQAVAERKPLLSEVIESLQRSHPSVGFNIEIKSDEQGDNIYQPPPHRNAALVMDLLNQFNLKKELLIVQSFDPRILDCMHALDKHIPYSLLVEGEVNVAENLSTLSFMPDYFAPDFTLLTVDIASQIRARGLRLMPWTVNEQSDMDLMIEWGATDIITDYPDRLVEQLKKR